MKSDKKEIGRLISGMKSAYARNENVMDWARDNSTLTDNTTVSALIAYDLQAGTYVENAQTNPEHVNTWSAQLAELLKPYMISGDRILEVGVGEATTLTGVMKATKCKNISAFGLDISWSRIFFAKKWVKSNSVNPCLFVGDLFHIPLADNSMDVVYTSHSLEPNGGKEKDALKELLRIARKAVVLVEPCYELATKKAQQRMRDHGYVRNLKGIAEALGVNVVDHRLLDGCFDPLNPSSVLTLLKSPTTRDSIITTRWECPLTGLPLVEKEGYFYADSAGIAYPILQGVPLLRAEHAVMASALSVSER
jgi:hypothetical protein